MATQLTAISNDGYSKVGNNSVNFHENELNTIAGTNANANAHVDHINANSNVYINVGNNPSTTATPTTNSYTSATVNSNTNGASDATATAATTSTTTTAVVITNTTTSTPTKGETAGKPEYVPAYMLLNKSEKKLVFVALAMGMFLASLDQLVVSVALPVIVADLGGSQYFTWVIAGYLLTASATMPLYGKYSDIYGRRSVFLFALIWFFAGSLFCAQATSIWLLIAARAIQGVGGGGLMSLTMILIGDIAKPAVRTKYMSSMSAIFGVSTVLGPLIGGGFTQYASWRWIFYLNLPFVLITMIVSWFLLGKIKLAQKDLPIDLIGSVLIVCGTTCFVLLVTWGGVTYAWDSSIIVSLIVVAVVFYALFVVQEFRHPEPIIKFQLYKIHNYLVSTIVMFLFGMAMLGAFAFVPFYFEDVLGDTPLIAGFKIIPMVIGSVIFSIFSGMFISKTGKYIAFPVLGLGVFSTGVGLCILLSKKTPYALIALYLFVVGSGMGLSFPVFNSIVQNSVPPQDMATCIAALVFLRQIGGCIGVSIFGTVYQRYTTTYFKKYFSLPIAESRALHHVFLGAAIIASIGFVVAFAIRNEKIFVRAAKKSLNENDTNKQASTEANGEKAETDAEAAAEVAGMM